MTKQGSFGRYQLLDRIATGGMAEIFEARLIGVEGFEKPIAIKRILPHWSQQPDFTAMLIDEAKIAVRLNHPNIVQIYELGKEGECYYLAMELIDGIDLRELQRSAKVAGQPMPLPLILWVIKEVAQALRYAHELKDQKGSGLQIVHRDISPQNILISRRGEVKVADFGIAKAIDSSHQTITGALKGKIAYMSPEQAAQQPVDQRSDLFSLGVLFYELATGKRLLTGRTDLERLDQVRQLRMTADHPSLQKVPHAVRDLICHLLSHDRERRLASAALLIERLEELQHELPGGRTEALVSYLDSIVGDSIGKNKDHKKKGVMRGPHRITHTLQRRSHLFRYGAIGMTLSLVILVGWFWHLKSQRLMAPSPLSETRQLPVKVESQSDQVVAPSATKAMVPGYFNLQARPWVYFYLKKGGKRFEGPVNQLELTPGSHQLKILFPPKEIEIDREIMIVAGRTVNCHVSLKGKGRLVCKTI